MEQPDKNDTSVMVRMPSDLKDALMRAAFANSRRITAEINLRLRQSLDADEQASNAPARPQEQTAKTGQPEARYRVSLNEAERALMDLIRAMSPERQGALLTVLKR